MKSLRVAAAALSVALLLTLTGCVERWLLIRSDPPDAEVFLDGQRVGKTPVKVPFHHYGTREVLLRHDHRESVSELVKVAAPWYQWFPFDLVFEHVWPWTIEDVHEHSFVLAPLDADALHERVMKLGQEPLVPRLLAPKEPSGKSADTP